MISKMRVTLLVSVFTLLPNLAMAEQNTCRVTYPEGKDIASVPLDTSEYSHELLPTQVYNCNEKGDKDKAGSFICAQMVFCAKTHAMSPCMPDNVQGTLVRMTPQGEVLSNYPLNVNKSSRSKGKPLYGDGDFIYKQFCAKKKDDGYSRRTSSQNRFGCLCGEKAKCAKAPNLELLSARQWSGRESCYNSNPNPDLVADIGQYGPHCYQYFRMTDTQNSRLRDLMNNISPLSAAQTQECKQQTTLDPNSGFSLGSFIVVKKVQKTEKICTDLSVGDLRNVYLKKYATTVSTDLEYKFEKDVFIGGKPLSEDLQNFYGADIHYAETSDTGVNSIFMVSELRRKLGGCNPQNAKAQLAPSSEAGSSSSNRGAPSQSEEGRTDN